MSRSLADSRRWAAAGTRLFTDAVARLDDESLDAPTPLPGWTRKHLIAHIAANAEGIGNLVRWAATGTETPMYASADERAAGIAKGSTMSAQQLTSWLTGSAEALNTAMDQLTPDQWVREVRTAQGRIVPATETPWMRAREVGVHTVDLAVGIGFADLPDDFNHALCEDILAKRGLDRLPPQVDGASLPQITAWLAGRPHALTDAPDIGPWL